MDPPRTAANSSPIMVTTTSRAFLSACLRMTTRLGHALGPGGPYVVAGHDVEHAGAHVPGQAPNETYGYGEARQHEVLDVDGVIADRRVPAGGEPAEPYGEEQDQQKSDPEAGRGDAEQRHGAYAVVEPGERPGARYDPQRDAQNDAYDDTGQRQREALLELLPDQGTDRLLGLDGDSKIALYERRVHPVEVLDGGSACRVQARRAGRRSWPGSGSRS